MALHPNLPKSPYEILDPSLRWFPADEDLREQGYEKLLPPFVTELRKQVKVWRESGYDGATATSKSLLDWWFNNEHILQKSDGTTFEFKYYFAQREAVETIVYLTDVIKVKDKYDLLRFDKTERVSPSMFSETWRRFVIKMATGSGKTKVLSLLMAWSYFHKLYEEGSTLARNFLLIAPNIIVLDRLRTDFDGMRIFYQDPILPENGYEGQNWQDDFQMTPHIQDDKMAWFKSIEDIHNRLKQKGLDLSIQIDVTATPKHNNGSIFVQTISDYPLVEAIHQNVVKHPVLPDSASRAKLVEKKSALFTEKYEDYIHLGYLEWKKVYEEHVKVGKKPILFVMTDDTKNCDEVAEYLENTYQDLKGAVLVIHTKNNGEISENVTGKSKEELEHLRGQANQIDGADSPYKAIVSVLMLKEGWDVKNVTTIVGLRAYAAQSNILPEQTLGRGLRRMYRESDMPEFVSVVGTEAFMDFVESIKSEGVELEKQKMGEGSKPKAPLVIEVDNENVKKDIEKLDIQIPVLTPRIYREYKNFSDLNPAAFGNDKFEVKQFSEEEKREIVFKDITTGEISHKTELDTNFVPNYQSVIGYFTQVIMKDLRLISGYDILYGKVKEFVTEDLFKTNVELEDLNTLRNLSELEFASFLEDCEDIISYVKNYFAVHFKIDYKNASGAISEFYPDFIVKLDSHRVYIVETKGREDLDDPLKIARLKQWCDDINSVQNKIKFGWIYIREEEYEKYGKMTCFADVIKTF